MIWIIGALQLILGVRFAARLAQTAGGQRIQTVSSESSERMSVLLPVLNESGRISRCLESLIAQPDEVLEILVIDGGSTDGTPATVEQYRLRDRRVRLIDASPVDPSWTGKAWGLQCGLHRADPAVDWILCVDADAWFTPTLARSLLAHAYRSGVSNFSVATEQVLATQALGVVHPAFLTTLVYRFGIPGKATSNPHRVQANGQCFLSRRETLIRTGAFETAQHSLCEDITIARRLAECGERVGFYEGNRLAAVTMYETWGGAWKNWPRSLPMRDQYFGWHEAIGLMEILLLQALPLWICCATLFFSLPRPVVVLNLVLVLARLGVLFGTARAYRAKPWTYWLSPFVDMAAVVRVITSAFKRRQIWRDRVYVRRPSGGYELQSVRSSSR